MESEERVAQLRDRADRADQLADTAELMGDDATAERLRAQAAGCRMVAMDLLDD